VLLRSLLAPPASLRAIVARSSSFIIAATTHMLLRQEAKQLLSFALLMQIMQEIMLLEDRELAY